MSEPTQKLLKELFEYKKDSGVLVRKMAATAATSVGEIAGGIDSKGYIIISVLNKRYKAHRIIWLYMTGEWPKEEIDHINHVRADNRWSNLREVSGKNNSKNMSRSKRNKSGYTGVHWNNQKNKWHVQIRANGKNKFLGLFDSIIDAANARQKANIICGYHQNHGNEKLGVSVEWPANKERP